jgi:hypothetical protein
MAHKFTTLRHPLEKLLEAEYFLAGVASTNGLEFQFNLNAFLGACRSVTFVMQKSMSDVSGFAFWYRTRQNEMKADAAMRFFLELRNISQHEGPVSYVGGGSTVGPRHWSYCFAGNREAVPNELLGIEVAQACADHLMKLAHLLLECFRTFPFACCPATAMSEEGMAALGYTLDDVCAALALPAGYLDVGEEIAMSEKLRYLAAREFDALEVAELERIVSGDLRKDGNAIKIPAWSGSGLTNSIVDTIENRGDNVTHPRDVFLAAVMKRINDIEKG